MTLDYSGDLDVTPALALLVAALDGDDERALVILRDAERCDEPQYIFRGLTALACTFGVAAYGSPETLRALLLRELRQST